MKPLLAGENLRADQPHRPGMRINFVKNVPRLTMHWHERAKACGHERSVALFTDEPKVSPTSAMMFGTA
jgi:hypothetical protein